MTDTVAIIGTQSSVMAHVLSHLANELHVPLLSSTALDPTLTPLQYPYFLKFRTTITFIRFRSTFIPTVCIFIPFIPSNNNFIPTTINFRCVLLIIALTFG